MATFYVDLENGNDVNNGTTFALRKRTLSSVTAAAGDDIRVMASPAATSLGINGTWTNKDITSRSIQSSTAATPIQITTSTAHGFSTGDTVCISGHTSNTNANGTWTITVNGSTTFTLNTSVGTLSGGASGTVTNITGRTVTLASAVTQTIISTGGSGSPGGNRPAWSGVTNVTVTTPTGVSKESTLADQFAVNATFTTGLIAWRQLPSTLNLSGFQQVSFWIMQTSGTLASDGNLRLRLCSDLSGVNPVNTINVPAMTALNTWYPITVDNGSALGSSIGSVSFALTSDQGAQTFRVCNIFASKAPSAADSLTLQSLIGKNDGVWYGIQSIDGTRVVLDQYASSLPTQSVTVQRKYTGTTATVTTFKREGIKLTSTQSNSSSGTAGNLINISGGWNRTDMSTQTSDTVLDGLYRTTGQLTSNAQFQNITNFGLVRNGASPALSIGSNNTADLNFICNSNDSAATITGSNSTLLVSTIAYTLNQGYISNTLLTSGNTIGFDNISGCNQDGIYIKDPGCTVSQAGVIDNCNYGMFLGASNSRIQSITEIKNCIAGAIQFDIAGSYDNIRIENVGTLSNNPVAFANMGGGNNVYIANGSTSGHTTNVISVAGAAPAYFRNVDFGESFSIWYGQSGGTGRSNIQTFLQDNNGVDYIYTEGGYIRTDTTTVYTGSTKSWAFYPTSTIRATSSFPLRLRLAQAAVDSGSLVTVTAWVRRSNTAISIRLNVPGGMVPGVNTVFDDITASANTWEQLSVTFTPSAAGVVEIEAMAWGGTTHTAWIDQISITQA